MFIKNTTLRIMVEPVTKLKLMPGVNDVDEKAWSKAKKNFEVEVERGELEDLSSKVEDDFETGLGAYNVGDAKALIAETADEALLKEWRDDEVGGKKRKGILEAIDSRFEEIEAGLVDGSED